jgi:hypothetical protein
VLFAELLAAATLYPVGPGLGWKNEAFSEVEALLELVLVTSKFSNIPEGGVIAVLALFPYRPTTSESATVVVSDGAAIKRVLAV